eukprot:TRINITY_DN6706_c1_g1_i1.p1 TRINITY_DN6706_c1_g1~~TRINITY_DN6706_c1_g1_i1.p1  ORF type:complete len:126 (-),score=18.96 TRINITY_DN6706_c1_g1_i1:32-364(-)
MLTAEYLSTINVFFTSFVLDFISLSETEQENLVEWVQHKGGVLLVAGCVSSDFEGCRQFVERFGVHVNGALERETSVSTCISDVHEILDGCYFVVPLIMVQIFSLGEMMD